MMTWSLASARRASILSLALTAALSAVAADGGTRETCPKAAPDASASDAEAMAPMTAIDIVFVTASAKKPGLAEQAPDEEWVNWKLDDISRLVAERAPLVLHANGLDGKVIILPAPPPGDAPDFSSLDPSRPALVFAPTQYKKWRQKALFPMGGALFYSVRPIKAGIDAPQLNCRIEVWGGFGPDPTWGVLKISRVDSEWVDTRLVNGLTMMAKHGVVKLSGEKAVTPK